MRSFLYPLLICFFPLLTEAQSPGGVVQNNTVWLRSDAGVTSTANIVSQWDEISGSNVTGDFSVQSLAGTTGIQTGPAFIDAGINFNPFIRFNGISNSLSSINSFPGISLVSNSNVTVFQVFTLRGGTAWLRWETDLAGATGRFGFQKSGTSIRFDFPKAEPATAGQNIGAINRINYPVISTVYADIASSVNSTFGAINNTIPIPGPGNFSSAIDKLVIGNANLTNLPAEIDIAEIIIYSRTLTSLERHKIESYLSIKYGFTLDQSAMYGNDCYASDGTIIWNRAANIDYAEFFTGIGRDDASGLSQKQSSSNTQEGIITLYNSGNYTAGNFPLLNSTNPNNFPNDKSFLLAGSNLGDITLNECIFNGKAKKIQRIWKVSKSNYNLPVTIAVDQGVLPSTIKNIIVSPDPSFPPTNTTVYPLTEMNGKIYGSVVFNQNDYFSFSTDTLIVTFSPTQPICDVANSGSVLTAVTGNFSSLTYFWTPGGVNTADLTNVPAGTYSLDITEAGCVSTYQVNLYTPQAPPVPIISGTTACVGYETTLNIQNVLPSVAYVWYFVDQNQNPIPLGTGPSYTTPVITTTTTFYIESLDHGCSNGLIPVVISLYPEPISPVVNNVSVCQGSTATFAVQNPLQGYSYNWYTETGFHAGSGNTFTTGAINTNTVYIVKSFDGNCNSESVYITAFVTKLTAPDVSDTEICPGNTAVLSVQNPDPSYHYNWYATSTDNTLLGTGVDFTTGIIFSPSTYYVELTDGTCKSPRTAGDVSLIPPPESPFVSVIDITGSSITFSWPAVQTAVAYELSIDGTGFSISTTGLTYTVSGLSHEQTVSVSVVAIAKPGCEKSIAGHATATTYGEGFYVPSAFTPNDDYINDIFKPRLPGGCTLNYFTIFDRWGKKVFSTGTPGTGWDGKFMGLIQNTGTYVWICRYRFGNGKPIDEKGSFILIR